MQPASPQELFIGILFVVFGFALLLVIIRAVIQIEKQDTERERIRHAPKHLREGRLLIRRENPDGSYHDLSLDTLSLGTRTPGTKRLPDDNRHKQLRWQPKNHRKNGKEVVVYRRHYPSNPREFYREEDE